MRASAASEGGHGGRAWEGGAAEASTEGPIWDRAETLPREQLEELQLRRLRSAVARVLHGQPFGAERLASGGITAAGDIGSLADLSRIPFTTKADLRASYPLGLLAVEREQLVRVQASSGSHGKPTVVGYTRGDLETWTELMARCMTMAGVRPGMVIHNANGYGLFTGGLGFHQGGERIGATVVPVSGGFTARQAMLLRDLGAHVLVSTPSYALAIAQVLAEGGGGGGRFAAAAARAVRQRAVDRGHARADRAGAAAACGQLLRPVRDVRARGGGRVPGPHRAARAGGPLHRRGD
jgi:phenylacetate-coenzyme A ligase PaaK-like adenylate-forming protein